MCWWNRLRGWRSSARQRRQSDRRKTLDDAVGVLRFAGLAFTTLNKSAHGGVLRYRGVRVDIQLRERVQDRVTGVRREVAGITSVTRDLRGSARGVDVCLGTL